jgi:tetratricopeptide (TPR) repeat protein
MTAPGDRIAPRPEGGGPAQSDFLFHVYRGGELLADNRLVEAQAELELAASLEPGDVRTQGLLAAVYFRSGFYARAITTYQALLRLAPEHPDLRQNLALCFLKAGQADDARALLEALVVEDVGDRRAWGYLAVALERLGYVDQAREAFVRAGHTDLAERIAAAARGAKSGLETMHGETTEWRSIRPGDSLAPLDAGELNVDLVRGDGVGAGSRARLASVAAPPLRPRLDTLGWGMNVASSPATAPRGWLEAPPLGNFLEDVRVDRMGDAQGVKLLGTRLARVELDQTLSPLGFAFRLAALRSYSGALEPELLPRQTRGEYEHPYEVPGETFGGIGSPFASMKGPGQLVLGPRASHKIQGFVLSDEIVFFREELMLGFDLALRYENGRLGQGKPGEAVLPLVQLHGSGPLLIEVGTELLGHDVRAGGFTVRRDLVVGWVGRLVPRPVPSGDAPGGHRGLVAFSGEGTVLVTAK